MTGNSDASTYPPLSTFQLGWVFFKLGMTAFGGLGASLALIHQQLVDRRRLLTPEQMTEALAITKPLPGSTIVQVVSYLGYRLGEWYGSAFATTAFLTAPMLGMVLTASLFAIANTLPGFPSVIKGLVAAVVGLTFATTIRLGKANLKGLVPPVLALVAFATAVRFQINAALIVVVGGLLGLLTLMPPSSTPDQKAGSD